MKVLIKTMSIDTRAVSDEPLELSYSVDHRTATIEVARGGDLVTFEGVDLIEAFAKVRAYFEDRGVLLICNGSRIDAHPSGMSRQVNLGKKLYVLAMGHAASPPMVNIFDEAPADRIGTVVQQETYFREWVKNSS